jgi:hypothetical protein
MDSPVDVIAFTDTAKAIAPWGREMRSHFGKDRRDHIHDTETRSNVGKDRHERIYDTERRSHSSLHQLGEHQTLFRFWNRTP